MACAVLAASVLIGASCVPGFSNPELRRVAVIPLENLTPEAGLDWVGAAAATIIAQEAAGNERSFVFYASDYATAVNGRATHILHGYFSTCAQGLSFHFALENVARSKISRRFVRCVPRRGVFEVSRYAGETLQIRRRRFGTSNLEALRQYARAFSLTNSQQQREALEAALSADPGFHEARLFLADLLIRGGERRAADKLLDAAPRTGLDDVTSAYFEFFKALLSDDKPRTAAALEKLSLLLPSDSSMAGRTAQTFLSLHDYAKAAEWYYRAAAADPENPAWWNSRAYAAAYANDPRTAFKSLEHYREADPENVNAIDSMGEICFRFGRLSEAEGHFLKAYERDPDFQGGIALLKAAWCRLFRGDRNGAQELFDRYAQAARDLGDPGIDLLEARWLYWTGRRSQAIEELERRATEKRLPPRNLSEMRVQLAAWRALMGQAAKAREQLRAAAKITGGRLVGEDAIITWRLSEAPDQEKRRQSASRESRLLARAYRLLLSEKPGEAAVPLREVYESAPALDRDRMAVLLAWAEIERGNLEEARRLLEPNPIWQPRTESSYHSLVFPRLFYLRGVLAARSGDRKAAIRNLRLFLDYSGDHPDVTGHEDAARQLLGRLEATPPGP